MNKGYPNSTYLIIAVLTHGAEARFSPGEFKTGVMVNRWDWDIIRDMWPEWRVKVNWGKSCQKEKRKTKEQLKVEVKRHAENLYAPNWETETQYTPKPRRITQKAKGRADLL